MNAKFNFCQGTLLVAMSFCSTACSSTKGIAPEPVDSDTGCSEVVEQSAKHKQEFRIHIGDGYQSVSLSNTLFSLFYSDLKINITSRRHRSPLSLSSPRILGGLSIDTIFGLKKHERKWFRKFETGDEIECVWLSGGKVVREETRLVVVS